MMQAFKTIETRPKVVEMQNNFSTIAVGQGALRLDVVPALEKQGLAPPRSSAASRTSPGSTKAGSESSTT